MKKLIVASTLLVMLSAPVFADSTEEVVEEFNEVFANTWVQTSALEVTTPNDDVAVVPLPAAGWMLLAGIGGLVALRRRARA